jgi:hypothetical protein
MPDGILSPEKADAYAPHLVAGALWRVAEAGGLRIMDDYDGHCDPHELRYLAKGSRYAQHTTIPHGTLAIYMGIVRVDEENHRGGGVRVPRHCFLVDGVRYITYDLNDYAPVAD